MIFKKVLRGYSPEQVDDYIGMLRDGYTAMEREFKELEAENGRLEETLRAQPDSAAISRALVSAELAADQITLHARVQADEIIFQAKDEAARILEEARLEAAQISAGKARIERQLRDLLAVLDRPIRCGERPGA
ncbi:MAG: DivIVA domain-containing protein [Oscillospiraceae bacterium]|jgi:cell division initiation protein|nr:DivIVA domain-containing protein [Oscillospiraceae bacterium]